MEVVELNSQQKSQGRPCERGCLSILSHRSVLSFEAFASLYIIVFTHLAISCRAGPFWAAVMTVPCLDSDRDHVYANDCDDDGGGGGDHCKYDDYCGYIT